MRRFWINTLFLMLFLTPAGALPSDICSHPRVLSTLRYWLAPKMHITRTQMLTDAKGEPQMSSYEREQFGDEGAAHCAYRYYFNGRFGEGEFMVASVDGRIFVLLGGRNASKNEMVVRGRFID